MYCIVEKITVDNVSWTECIEKCESIKEANVLYEKYDAMGKHCWVESIRDPLETLEDVDDELGCCP
jgi:hypothetical protein